MVVFIGFFSTIMSLFIYLICLKIRRFSVRKGGATLYVMTTFIIQELVVLSLCALRGMYSFNDVFLSIYFYKKILIISFMVCATWGIFCGLRGVVFTCYQVSGTQKRVGSIEFYRFVFSLIVMIFHASRQINNSIPFKSGRLGVEFFFVVSGFLLAQSASKIAHSECEIGSASSRYALAKIRRFFPEVLIGFAFAFIVEHIRLMNFKVSTLVVDMIKSVFQVMLIWMSGLETVSFFNVTWYMSVLIIVSLILFPLALKNIDLFLNVFAPLITLFVMGYLCLQDGDLKGNLGEYMGFFHKGMLRGIGEMSLGCVSYRISLELKKMSFTHKGEIIISIIETICYVLPIIWIFGHNSSDMDFICLFFIAVGITLSFSSKGVMHKLFQNKTVLWLGQFSFPIYLGHTYWAKSLNSIFPNLNLFQSIVFYVVLSIFSATAIMCLSQITREFKGWSQIKNELICCGRNE